jgi:hypothetical protein
MFAEEQAKGNTRIIREDETKQSSPRKAYNKPTHSNPGSTSALPRSPTESSIVVYPEYQYGEPSRRFETPVRPPSAISRSASEPSSKMRRFEIIDSFFNKESPSSNRHTQVSTPTSTSMRSVRIQDNSPEIIVKTPPWVSSYPKALKESQVLSPLDNPSLLSLRSFKEGSRHGTPVQSIQRLHNAGELRSPTTASESSIYVSRTMQPTTAAIYKEDVDPRSPIINASQAELMSMKLVCSVSYLFSYMTKSYLF